MGPFITFQSQDHLSRHLLTNRKIRGTVNSTCAAQLGKKMQGSLLKYLKRTLLRARGRERMRLPAQIALIKYLLINKIP